VERRRECQEREKTAHGDLKPVDARAVSPETSTLNLTSLEELIMPETERFTNIVFGSGTGGKIVAWTLAEEGQRTAMVERKWIGGSCHNIACLPSKNVIHSAKVASLFGRAAEFGLENGAYSINMERVRERKRKMVDASVKYHLDKLQGKRYRPDPG
jgi:hypothetical protein